MLSSEGLLAQLPQGVANVLGLGAQKSYFTGRMQQDRMPFASENPVLLTEEEIETQTREVADVRVKLFDLRDDDARAQYQLILTCVMQGWIKILTREFYVEEDPESKQKYMHVYVEYNIPTRQMKNDRDANKIR